MQFSSFAHEQTPLRDAITSAYRRDEQLCMEALLPETNMPPDMKQKVQSLARRLVTEVRAQRTRASGVDALMHEFSLSSQEGVALMCLAEALLRIPDRATADKLIRDKIAKGDWRAHLGQSPSTFVNAATWGLVITGRLVSTHTEQGLSLSLTRLIAKGGEPLIRKGVDLAMRMLGKQFVTGETIEDALSHSRERVARGYRFSYDMLGEAAMTDADAQRYFDDYESAIHAIGREADGRGVVDGPGISIKISALHARYHRTQYQRVMDELYPRVKTLMLLGKHYNIGLNIDAEESERMELSLDLVEKLAFESELAGWDGIGIVVQAYQKRCPFIIDYLVDLARRAGRCFMVRLVKGAYWDAEIKRAQVDGQDNYPVYTRKVYTDVSYLACVQRLLAAQDVIYPQFATHNAYSLAAIYYMGEGKQFEFQCLHGMGETLYDQVVGRDKLGRLCRIYAPVGSHETLLGYLVRRLLENGANTSFVNRIVDESVSIDELVVDPVTEAKQLAGSPNPYIPLPLALYGAERRNSRGMDFSNEQTLQQLARDLSASEQQTWRAEPMLADGARSVAEAVAVYNPSDQRDCVGQVCEANTPDVECALAYAAQSDWPTRTPNERAACLLRMGDLLETHRGQLMGLIIREAGKSLANALAEIREAVDFCRYYAQQAQNELRLESHVALGPVVCISPWNFPLAIFIGQVTAALAAGNPVLAKPAEQTPLIAAEAVRLLHVAGVTRDALQLLPGRGETVGAALVADARVRGVIFTGSTEVAQLINRVLAQSGRDTVLIAETGGQNAMIVDSSALPEQVVTDVVNSAFDSAGQRCSALRVLYVQSDIADKVITMLKGAMALLTVGNPAQLATDIGPVIDADAQHLLLQHIEGLRRSARWVEQTPLSLAAAHGTFVAPTLCEIASISELTREVFGPVLHVVRFQANQLAQVISDINASGYGLTLGVHSRIDENIDVITETAHVGNIYVNRNIVGAVVGVQPFGGEGLSGTGPKAGGPLYLHRLVRSHSEPQLGTGDDAPALPELAILEGLLGSLGLSDAECIACVRELEFARRHTPLGRILTLTGPTGEANSLRFAPRGTVACVANTVFACVQQLIAVYATGNRALLVGCQHTWPRTLPLVSVASLDDGMTVHAVLCAGDAGQQARLRQTLAERSGALLPVISPDEAGHYPLHRLVAERALSVNTTAAGGNTSLMSLGDGSR